MKGFSSKWCQWIDSIVKGGTICVKVNDEMGHYLQTKKGLRQGDLLSPILFNLIVDILPVLIERSKELKILCWACSPLSGGWLIHLAICE
jgi:hypothetical protein